METLRLGFSAVLVAAFVLSGYNYAPEKAVLSVANKALEQVSAQGIIEADTTIPKQLRAPELTAATPRARFAQSATKTSAAAVQWMRLAVDSGTVHAAVAVPRGKGPFPAIILLHGTHGFAQEYVQLAQRLAEKGFVGIAACWFAGRRGAGVRFITPIDYPDAPPYLDIPSLGRFRLARKTIDSLVRHINTLPTVRPGQVALFGHSLGGGAALNYAITHPGKVQAVMLNSTGFPPEVIHQAQEVSAPILLLHGTADSPNHGGSSLTTIEKARQFEAALRKANKAVEVKYYEGSDHNTIFQDSTQLNDTVSRLAAFLRTLPSR